MNGIRNSCEYCSAFQNNAKGSRSLHLSSIFFFLSHNHIPLLVSYARNSKQRNSAQGTSSIVHPIMADPTTEGERLSVSPFLLSYRIAFVNSTPSRSPILSCTNPAHLSEPRKRRLPVSRGLDAIIGLSSLKRLLRQLISCLLACSLVFVMSLQTYDRIFPVGSLFFVALLSALWKQHRTILILE
jgi:hypothetical protein